MTLIYDDPRYGDRYEVELSPCGVFLHAWRHIDRLGHDPLFYDRLSDVPQPQQNEIQTRIRNLL